MPPMAAADSDPHLDRTREHTKEKAAPIGTAFLFCFTFPKEDGRGELLAFAGDSFLGIFSSAFNSVCSAFSSVGSSFSSAFSSVASSFGSAFSSFCGRVCSFVSHCACFFSSFASFLGSLFASSEAQSRGSDCGGENDLTHNIKSLLSEWIVRGPYRETRQAELFDPRLCDPK